MTALATLSHRETQIAKLLALGHSAKRIAAGQGLSYRTVEHYSTTVLKKLSLHNRVELAHWALAKGWVENLFL